MLGIARDLTASLAASDRYTRLLDAVRRVIPCDAACLLRVDGPYLTPVAGFGLSTAALSRRYDRREQPRLDVILQSREPVRFPPDSHLADPFDGQPPESLSFVVPLGRLLLQLMGEALSTTGFAVTAALGAAAGSFSIAWARDELRWEAFDDQREMRRHLLGAVLMGIGGVLARGCTIGQGISGASTLSIAAPVAVFAMVVGARLGLAHLLEGRPLFARRH